MSMQRKGSYESVSIILAMHEKEVGVYGPEQKFTYPEQEKLPSHDNTREKKTLMVDVRIDSQYQACQNECRSRMLEWSTKVSASISNK